MSRARLAIRLPGRAPSAARAVLLTLALTLGLVLGLVACGGKPPAVGVLLPQSGPHAEAGRRALAAVLQAWDERPVAEQPRLLVADDGGSALTTTAAFDDLVDQGATVILGPLDTECALAASAAARLRRVPFLTPSATGEEVTRDNPYALRSCVGDDELARELAVHARYTLRLERVGVVVDLTDRHALGLAEAFEREFSQRRGRIVGELPFHPDEPTGKVLATAAGWDADGLLLAASHGPVMDLLQTARPRDLADLVLLGDSRWNGPGLREQLAGRVAGAWVAGHFDPGEAQDEGPRAEAVADFLEAYRRREDAPPDDVAALTYDAARAVLQVFDGRRDGPELARALRELQYVVGVTGTLHMEGGGRPDGKTLVLRQLHDPSRPTFFERVGD